MLLLTAPLAPPSWLDGFSNTREAISSASSARGNLGAVSVEISRVWFDCWPGVCR